MQNLELLWQTAFNDEVGNEQNQSDINPVDWRAGGRATKEWPNKEDGDWWNKNGFKFLEDFVEFWDNSGWQVWHTPEGEPALELQINVHYGDTLVKAFIDLVAVNKDGELIVVDFKTGKSMPSNMQLGLYASSLEKQFGVRPVHGYYYDARKAQSVLTDNLARWTPQLFEYLFKQFEFAVENKIFIPNVGMACSSCSVADYCHANGGSMAHMIDPLYAIGQRKEQ